MYIKGIWLRKEEGGGETKETYWIKHNKIQSRGTETVIKFD